MSDNNLHTCDKSALGWRRDGVCRQCELEENFVRWGGGLPQFTKPDSEGVDCKPEPVSPAPAPSHEVVKHYEILRVCEHGAHVKLIPEYQRHCPDIFGPFECEKEFGHEGPHKFDGKEVGSPSPAQEVKRDVTNELLEYLGVSWRRSGDCLTVNRYTPKFKIESYHPASGDYKAHYDMDAAWGKIERLYSDYASLSAELAGYKMALVEAHTKLDAAGIPPAKGVAEEVA